jgi:hypothetical protein
VTPRQVLGSARRLVLILSAAALASLALASTALGATTYFAKAGTSGSCATHADPCALLTAVGLTADGDSVVMESGPTYVLTGTQVVNIAHNINLGGEAGQPPPTVQGAPGAGNVLNVTGSGGNGPTVHDIHLVHGLQNVALRMTSGTVERLVSTVSGGERACDVAAGLLRDSVCWSQDDDGVVVIAPGGAATFSPQIRNVTGIGGPAGNGIALYGSPGEIEHVDAANVIGRGGANDVLAAASGGDYTISLRSSNYAKVTATGGGVITPPGSSGNQTATPLFANAAAGDFHELAASPTVDAGVSDPLIGSLDLDRNARVQPECLGGEAKPDIGAYEISPPAPPLPACEEFTVGALKRKKNGSAKLTVNVPGSGNLKAAGKGLKATSADAAGAGDVVLTLRATGKAKRKLAVKGKAKLKVKLSWTPTGGSAATKIDKVKLTRHRGRRR